MPRRNWGSLWSPVRAVEYPDRTRCGADASVPVGNLLRHVNLSGRVAEKVS